MAYRTVHEWPPSTAVVWPSNRHPPGVDRMNTTSKPSRVVTCRHAALVGSRSNIGSSGSRAQGAAGICGSVTDPFPKVEHVKHRAGQEHRMPKRGGGFAATLRSGLARLAPWWT